MRRDVLKNGPRAGVASMRCMHCINRRRRELNAERKGNAVIDCPRCGTCMPRWEWPKDTADRLTMHCGRCDSPTAHKSEEHKRAVKRAYAARIGDTAHRSAAQLISTAAGKWARQETIVLRELAARAKREARPHDAHVLAWKRRPDAEADRYRRRYHTDPEFQLRERLRRQFRKKAEAVPGLDEVIRGALKASVKSLKVESLLGYSIAQLKAHLERQFTKGMSWTDYSRRGWHIDHILPRRCFDLTTLEGVQAFWALANLRPLAARENLKKRDRIEFLV